MMWLEKISQSQIMKRVGQELKINLHFRLDKHGKIPYVQYFFVRYRKDICKL